jgi:hypothetical protein
MELHIIVNLIFKVLPVVQKLVILGCLIAGVFFLRLSILSIFKKSQFSSESQTKSNSKASIKYTAVFPYIKREIAKFEDREQELIQKMGHV